MSTEAQLRRLARHDAAAFGLDPDVFERQINQESGFNPRARSGAGAIGIAQFEPATARGVGVNPLNPRQALRGAAKLMASYVHKYGSYQNALIAYNAGPGAVGSKHLPAETVNYVNTILGGKSPSTRGVTTTSGGGGGGPTRTSQTVQLPQAGQVDIASLLQAIDQPRPVQVSAPPPPAFAAQGPPTPFGYTAPAAVGSAAPAQPSIDDLLKLATTTNGPSAGTATTTQTVQNPQNGNSDQIHPSHTGTKGGTTMFDGKPVASWIAVRLERARAAGWKGTVNSGFRSVAEQRKLYDDMVAGRRAGPVAKPGQSNHNFTAFPGGAVDVTDAPQLAAVLKHLGIKKLQWAGSADPVHFSNHHGGY